MSDHVPFLLIWLFTDLPENLEPSPAAATSQNPEKALRPSIHQEMRLARPAWSRTPRQYRTEAFRMRTIKYKRKIVPQPHLLLRCALKTSVRSQSAEL